MVFTFLAKSPLTTSIDQASYFTMHVYFVIHLCDNMWSFSRDGGLCDNMWSFSRDGGLCDNMWSFSRDGGLCDNMWSFSRDGGLSSS
jgi:ubiquinone biosynthesis protein COQ9